MSRLFREFDMAWLGKAGCRSNKDLFFQQYNEDGEDYWLDLPLAKALCNACPGKSKCLDYGIDDPEGIWGGTTPNERRRIISKNKKSESPYIHDLDSVLDSVVDDYLFAEGILDVKTKMQALQSSSRKR